MLEAQARKEVYERAIDDLEDLAKMLD